jgi:hypothetical protein
VSVAPSPTGRGVGGEGFTATNLILYFARDEFAFANPSLAKRLNLSEHAVTLIPTFSQREKGKDATIVDNPHIQLRK